MEIFFFNEQSQNLGIFWGPKTFLSQETITMSSKTPGCHCAGKICYYSYDKFDN